jgi:hypothetical protein
MSAESRVLVLGTQSVVALRDEIEIAAISQELKLLAYFWLHVLVPGIEATKPMLERINIVELKFSFTDRLHASHYLKQPTSCFMSLISQKTGPLPLGKHGIFRLKLACPDNEDFARFRYLVEQDI